MSEEKNKQVKRRPGIAKSVEYGRQNIVHNKKGSPEIISR